MQPKDILRKARSFPAGHGGATAVEFALVAPILLFLFLGIMVLGLYLGIAHGVQEAAGHAARAAIAGLDPAERTRLAQESVRSFVGGSLLLKQDLVTVDAAPAVEDPDKFRVTLSYDLRRTAVAVAPKILSLPDSVVRSTVIKRGGL